MSYRVDLTTSEILELKNLRRVEKDGKILRRYQCIWFAHEKFPKKEIASLLSVNIDTVTDWIKLFNKNRLEGLRKLQYGGRRPSSLDAVKGELLNYIKTEPVSKLSELQHYLKTKHSVDIEHSWLSRYCKKNSIALIKKQD
jgi:transposase